MWCREQESVQNALKTAGNALESAGGKLPGEEQSSSSFACPEGRLGSCLPLQRLSAGGWLTERGGGAGASLRPSGLLLGASPPQ